MPDYTNYTEELDNNTPKNKIKGIKAVLRRYLPTNDNGDSNPEFDDSFTSEQAIDEIYNIVGGI